MSASKKSSEDDFVSIRGLPQSKRLYWNAQGSTNLIQWSQDVVIEAQTQFDIFAECLREGYVPDDWTDRIEEPDGYDEMSNFQKKKVENELIYRDKLCNDWQRCKPKMTAWLHNY
eukprot:gene11952-13540_t